MPNSPLKPDKWYEKHGVKPPERITHHGSDSMLPDNHSHVWKHASGPWIHCDEGSGFGHGIPFDHVNLKLTGTNDDGEPIFEPITLANQAEVDKAQALAENRT